MTSIRRRIYEEDNMTMNILGANEAIWASYSLFEPAYLSFLCRIIYHGILYQARPLEHIVGLQYNL